MKFVIFLKSIAYFLTVAIAFSDLLTELYGSITWTYFTSTNAQKQQLHCSFYLFGFSIFILEFRFFLFFSSVLSSDLVVFCLFSLFCFFLICCFLFFPFFSALYFVLPSVLFYSSSCSLFCPLSLLHSLFSDFPCCFLFKSAMSFIFSFHFTLFFLFLPFVLT